MFKFDPTQEQNLYRADMLRRAERHRMVRDALAGRRGRVAFYAPLLASVGKRMMSWGYTLQARYTAAPENAMPYTVKPRSSFQTNG